MYNNHKKQHPQIHADTAKQKPSAELSEKASE